MIRSAMSADAQTIARLDVFLRLRIEDLAASGQTAIDDLRLSEDRGEKHIVELK